jgi:hypothetical protein
MMHPFVATTAGLYIIYEAKALYDMSTAGDGFSTSYPLLIWAEEAVSRTPIKLILAIAKTGDAIMEVPQSKTDKSINLKLNHQTPCVLLIKLSNSIGYRRVLRTIIMPSQ